MATTAKTLVATDDGELVARALMRDRDAIAAITTRYNRRLFRVARSILKNDDDAEDTLQSAYLKAFTGLGSFRQESSLGTWLIRIVMNEARGLRRRRHASVVLDETQVPSRGTIIPFPINSEVDPERGMAQRQIQVFLEQAIDELPENFRTVLVARVLEEMSIEETADALGIRPETVKTRLHRARSMLRRALERRIGPILMDAFPFDGWRCKRMTAAVFEKLGLSP